MLVTCQRFGDLFLFGLVWQYSSIQKNIIKVGSKSWILTCSCYITLSLPFYTYPASKRELNFCNGYLSLLYFCHCPCILPCLTQSITKDLPGLKSIIQALQIRLSTVLIKAGSIKVNNFISGACKCTAMVFFQGGKGAFVYHPPYHKLMVPAKAFFIIFYQMSLRSAEK